MFSPLPPWPNLEFERKQAKNLLRQLRSGDPDPIARARARHPDIPSSVAEIKLADAQLIIARDYGFASWARLVQYFSGVERQQMGRQPNGPPNREHYEHMARSLITQHQNRRVHAGRSFAASVPRLYGKTFDEVFASRVNEDDARLTIARQYGAPSWDVLVETIDAKHTKRSDPQMSDNPLLDLARNAINAADLAALMTVVGEHPELLRPTKEEQRESRTVIASALSAEKRMSPEARMITDWLESRGAEVSITLNTQLCGHMNMKPEEVRFLLGRGADPNWIAPNGYSVLEHALLRCWNGEAVDLIAQRVTPKRALWVAAGLGDVDGVNQFFARNGKPTAAAYRNRPDFAAIGGPHHMLSAPVPDETELLAEVFYAAWFNDRIAVLDCLIDRGFPVNFLGWEQPFVSIAAANRRVLVVECLVRRGADLDLRGRHPDASARDMARESFARMPDDPAARRILELCGAGGDGR